MSVVPQCPAGVPISEEFHQQLRDKSMLFTCVGTDTTKYEVYDYIANLGINLIVIDSDKSTLAQVLRERGTAHVILMDLSPRQSLVDEIKESVDSHLAGRPLDGCATFWDDAVGLNARLCEAFGLPGNPVRGTDIAHDKAASRAFIEALGWAGPKSLVVNNTKDVEEAVQILAFPAIMKPLYGAASIGVMKINNAEEARAHFQTIQSTLDGVYSSGDLMGLTFDDADASVSTGDASLRAIVFEEFLDGPEFDCDVALQNGEVVYCNLMDDWEFEPPHFIELGSSCPSSRPQHIQESVREYSKRILQAMGFTDGVYHVEVIYSHRLGPCLVELNPRMGGGPVRSIHKSIYGTDLADLTLAAALGISHRPEIAETTSSTAVSINLFAQKTGTLAQSIEQCMAYIDERTDVVSKLATGEKGDQLTGWYDGYPSALGRVNFKIDLPAEEAIKEGKEAMVPFYKNVELSRLRPVSRSFFRETPDTNAGH